MMLSLRASLVSDLLSNVKKELQALRDRVDRVENTMGEYSFNSLVDAHNAHTEEITWIKDKIADLENKSRRNNIKIRGIKI